MEGGNHARAGIDGCKGLDAGDLRPGRLFHRQGLLMAEASFSASAADHRERIEVFDNAFIERFKVVNNVHITLSDTWLQASPFFDAIGQKKSLWAAGFQQ